MDLLTVAAELRRARRSNLLVRIACFAFAAYLAVGFSFLLVGAIAGAGALVIKAGHDICDCSIQLIRRD